MLERFRPRLTFANVTSVIALFVALGGSGYAAVKINGRDLEDRSVAGKKLKKDTLTGTEVQESALAKVPSASIATNARNLGGKPPSAYTLSTCRPGMVKVGRTCIDRYEDSVWSKPIGGIQYGISSADYPCAANGNDCKGKIFARSVAGVKPSAYITWFQAEQALANSGKRMPTNAEWQQAAAGTPDMGAGPGPQDCNTNSPTSVAVATGSRTNCVSVWGANDMTGNVFEWVADWVPAASDCPGWGAFSNDYMCLAGAKTDSPGPGALIRGGGYGSASLGGTFAIMTSTPQSVSDGIGFRGAR